MRFYGNAEISAMCDGSENYPPPVITKLIENGTQWGEIPKFWRGWQAARDEAEKINAEEVSVLKQAGEARNGFFSARTAWRRGDLILLVKFNEEA